MESLAVRARKIGLLYLVFSLVAIANEFFLSAGFVVPGDAAATAQRIAAAGPMFRVGILASFANLVIFVFLVVGLHDLFKDVDGRHALLMVVFVTLGVAVSLVGLVLKSSPLVLHSGSGYLSEFTRPQLDALALGLLEVRRNGSMLATAFWGLWLFPFGALVIKSGFIPKILGIALMVAGTGYLASAVVAIVLPAQLQIVSRLMTPLYFGELPIIFWLLVKGARVPQPRPLQAIAS
jgi:hypothetical protein